ncbi:MAG: NADH:flavin oxidoreductase [Parvibaculum sp.]|nr:NADH:flavin oxidoreductase [Parvibaculum sp.]
MADLFEPLAFTRGKPMKNRFMLAPLTNSQSHPDGKMSDDEFNWLTYRATGGFGMVMSCAAHVQRIGQGFPGQLGVFGDEHLAGLTRLAAEIKARGALSSVQLHHAGIRSPEALTGERPVGPSDFAETNARALTTTEVEALIEDFIAAAVRCEKAGFEGVELHGAHGYILCAFLSSETNQRTDRFGGSLENRSRIVFDIIKGIRARTGKDFQLGLRLSPERFGIKLAEALQVAEQVMTSGDIDYLDMSLWDVFKAPVETDFAHKPLIDWFAALPRGNTKLGVAGKIMSAEACRKVLAHGADFSLIGRGAILHHDFPLCVKADADFKTIALPVTRDYLRSERLGPAFIEYMNTWKGFVVQDEAAETAAE